MEKVWINGPNTCRFKISPKTSQSVQVFQSPKSFMIHKIFKERKLWIVKIGRESIERGRKRKEKEKAPSLFIFDFSFFLIENRGGNRYHLLILAYGHDHLTAVKTTPTLIPASRTIGQLLAARHDGQFEGRKKNRGRLVPSQIRHLDGRNQIMVISILT